MFENSYVLFVTINLMFVMQIHASETPDVDDDRWTVRFFKVFGCFRERESKQESLLSSEFFAEPFSLKSILKPRGVRFEKSLEGDDRLGKKRTIRWLEEVQAQGYDREGQRVRRTNDSVVIF